MPSGGRHRRASPHRWRAVRRAEGVPKVERLPQRGKWTQIESLVKVLLSVKGLNSIYLIDNSPAPSEEFKQKGTIYIFTGSNRGYGAGHNIAMRKTLRTGIPYHLVINPDVELEASVVEKLLLYMEKHPAIGHIMPKVVFPDGSLQYLCKLLPTPSDLLMNKIVLLYLIK